MSRVVSRDKKRKLETIHQESVSSDKKQIIEPLCTRCQIRTSSYQVLEKRDAKHRKTAEAEKKEGLWLKPVYLH